MNREQLGEKLRNKEPIPCKAIKVQTSEATQSLKSWNGQALEPYLHDDFLIVFDTSFQEYEDMTDRVFFFGQSIGGVKLSDIRLLEIKTGGETFRERGEWLVSVSEGELAE